MNPDVLDLLKNKVQDCRHLPISIKEGVALERTLRSMMESHSFLTWSVMGLLKSLHLQSLLPKDDPVITQLQKSFSKACSSLASSMTTSAAFVTMKRRQLLLSHVVPSVSEAQKRNLLSDPFFQTSSLFDTSSVESARSAARDMSLFKPRHRLPKLDGRDPLAHRAAEVLLGSTLDHRRLSAHLPLSDSSLERKVMLASTRSLPEPLRSEGVFGSRSLVPHRRLAVCTELGIQVNLTKSSLVPSQSIVYLGMEIHSLPFIARPTPARANNLIRLIEEFLSAPSPPACLWRRLLGHLSSLILLVSGGMIRMRLLQLCLKGQWDFLDDQFQVSWSPLCREDLLWWSSQVQLREGVSLSLPAPDISFFSDASDVGWGALVGEHHASGLWLPHQKALSINMRELLAVQLGLQAFEHLIVGMSVALFCDNTTTVAYLRRSGGTFSSALNSTAREVLLWAESRRIRLLPQFIMGSSNITADALSRPNQVIGSEWTLHQEVVDQLVHRWPAMIDLFATSLTARLPVYFSPASDPRAAGTDALLQPWDDLQAYAFTPIAIIS